MPEPKSAWDENPICGHGWNRTAKKRRCPHCIDQEVVKINAVELRKLRKKAHRPRPRITADDLDVLKRVAEALFRTDIVYTGLDQHHSDTIKGIYRKLGGTEIVDA